MCPERRQTGGRGSERGCITDKASAGSLPPTATNPFELLLTWAREQLIEHLRIECN